MLTDYLTAAMHQAHYEILEDGNFYGQIPGFAGVFASQSTLEATRQELQSVLEGWILLGLRLGDALPVVNGIDLAPALHVA
jgi:predicted RNase H-like HicB family nuclease